MLAYRPSYALHANDRQMIIYVSYLWQKSEVIVVTVTPTSNTTTSNLSLQTAYKYD